MNFTTDPTAAMLKALSPAFKKAGLEPRNLTFLVAPGAHRAPTEEERAGIAAGGIVPDLD